MPMRRNSLSEPALSSLSEAEQFAPGADGRKLLLPTTLPRSDGGALEAAKLAALPTWRRTSVDLWRVSRAVAYFGWLQSRSHLILCAWLLITAGAYLYGQDALTLTTTQSNGPANMKAQRAQVALGTSFPHMLWDQAVILVRCTDGCDIFNPQVELFVSRLEELLQRSYLPTFRPPFSIFSLLPTDAEIGGGEADAELQRRMEKMRQRAIERQEASLAGRRFNASANSTTLERVSALHQLLANVSSGDPRLQHVAMERVEGAGDAFALGLSTGAANLSLAPLSIPGAPQLINTNLERLTNGSVFTPQRTQMIANLTRAEALLRYGDAFAAGVRESTAPAADPSELGPATAASTLQAGSGDDVALSSEGTQGTLNTAAMSGESDVEPQHVSSVEMEDAGSGSGESEPPPLSIFDRVTDIAGAFVRGASEGARMVTKSFPTPYSVTVGGLNANLTSELAGNASLADQLLPSAHEAASTANSSKQSSSSTPDSTNSQRSYLSSDHTSTSTSTATSTATSTPSSTVAPSSLPSSTPTIYTPQRSIGTPPSPLRAPPGSAAATEREAAVAARTAEQDAKLASALDEATQTLYESYDAALHSKEPIRIPPGTAKKIREVCAQRKTTHLNDRRLSLAADQETASQEADGFPQAARQTRPRPPSIHAASHAALHAASSQGKAVNPPTDSTFHAFERERRLETSAAAVASAALPDAAASSPSGQLSLQLLESITESVRSSTQTALTAPSAELRSRLRQDALANHGFDVSSLRGDKQLDVLCTSQLARNGLDALTDAAGNTAQAVRKLFLSNSGTATLISVPLLPGYEAHLTVVQSYLVSTVAEAARQTLPPEQYQLHVGGDSQMRLDTSVATLDDFHRVDLVSMPLALCALMAFLVCHQASSLKAAARNLPSACRLLLVPILCIPAAVSAALAILKLAWAAGLPLNFVVPVLVLATVVAVSIDYALFLLASYSSALQSGAGGSDAVPRAVLAALQDSGHTVLMSGSVLALAFLPTVLFPLDWMLTLGICSSASVICAVVINISLGPALILSTPFLSLQRPDDDATTEPPSRKTAPPAAFNGTMNQAGADAVAAMNEGADALHPPPPPQRSSTLPSSTTERQAQRRSWLGSVRGFDYWSHFGSFLVENPGRVVVIAFILLSPFIWIALAESQFTAMPTQIVPRSTPSGAVMLQLEREFGGGRMYPFYLYVRKRPEPRTKQGASVLSAAFFREAHDVLAQLAATVPNTPVVNITGAAYANGEPVPFELIAMAFDASNPLYDTPTGEHLRVLASVFFSPLGDATFFYVTFGVDPFGAVASEWLLKARAFLDTISKASLYDWEIAGIPAITLDTQDAVMARFPLTAIATGACILALLAYAFGSALVPVRSVLTTAATLGFVYGSLQILQAGVPYRFLRLELWAPWEAPGVSWIVPVMTFTVLAGLNTDYDVFLVSGIRKMRTQGMSSDEAIIQGLRSNGGVINTAGLIMALAFSGLLGSSTLAVQQVAYVVVLSVLFDTLVVRSILVPAMMALLRDYNWWPARMPEVTRYFSASTSFSVEDGRHRALATCH